MRQELHKFITENFMFGKEDLRLSDSDSLVETGLIDSTGILELMSFLEETYGIDIDDTELIPENLDSIDAIVRFVDLKRLETEKTSPLCR
jgi:acyl carrier protein